MCQGSPLGPTFSYIFVTIRVGAANLFEEHPWSLCGSLSGASVEPPEKLRGTTAEPPQKLPCLKN